MSKKNCGVSRKFFFWNASASESQFASKILDFFDTSRVEEYGVFEWSISEYMGIVTRAGDIFYESVFSKFWDILYGPFRLGLGTDVHLWSQFQI